MKQTFQWVWLIAILVLFTAVPVVKEITGEHTPGQMTVWYICLSIVLLCVLAIVAITLRTKRKTGQYPKELSAESQADGQKGSPSEILAMFTLFALLVLGEVAAMKSTLAFVTPGLTLALFVYFTGRVLSHSFFTDYRGFRLILWQVKALAVSSAFGLLTYFAWIRQVISGQPAALVWTVAIIEACLLTPFIAWYAGRGQEAD